MKEIGRLGLAVLAIALWFGSGSIAEAQPPIRIGASLSQTGAYAALGQNQLRGYQLCVKQANEKGGALGRKLELIVGDDECTAARATAIYEKLVTQTKVDAILGPYSSSITDAVADLAETDFSGILGKVKAASPDVLAAATYFEDAVAITRHLKELGLNPKMFGVTVGGNLPKFHETLGRTAEFVYGASQWEPELVTLRAGGLIPIARQYPGAKEFVEVHRTEFPGADLPYHSAAGYGGCQILVEALKRAGVLDGEKIREAILRMDLNTAFGAFKVDRDGIQVAHKALVFQWQDGKKVIVWPEELAPGKPRFPTPPWSHRP